MSKSNLKKWIVRVYLVLVSLVIFVIIVKDILQFSYRSHQVSEERYLLTLFKAQKSYFDKNGKYASQFSLLLLSDKVISYKYNLYLGTDVLYGHSDVNKNMELPAYLSAYLSNRGYVIFAIGQLDSDPALDIWMITEKGTPVHLQDDYYLQNQP